MADHKRWFNEQPVVRAPEDEGVTLTSMGSMLTRLMAERDEKSEELYRLTEFLQGAQADMIERLRAALDAMLDGKTPQEMANTIDDNLSDPLFDRLPRETQQRIIRRRNALRALQPGDLGSYE